MFSSDAQARHRPNWLHTFAGVRSQCIARGWARTSPQRFHFSLSDQTVPRESISEVAKESVTGLEHEVRALRQVAGHSRLFCPPRAVPRHPLISLALITEILAETRHGTSFRIEEGGARGATRRRGCRTVEGQLRAPRHRLL